MQFHEYNHLQDNVTALHIAVQHRRTAVVMEIVKRNKGIKEILDARDHVSCVLVHQHYCLFLSYNIDLHLCVSVRVGRVS